MCYSVYLSTDFEGDLSQHNTELIRFDKDFNDAELQVIDLLQYQNAWQ